jgi:hypothetical protein
MMKRSLLLAGALAALTTAAPAQAESPMVHLVLKFVKDKPTRGPAVVLAPASCPACVVGHDPGFERDNARETLVELHVPAQRSLELAFDSQPGVRRVLLETTDLPFRREGNRLLVALAPLHGDLVDTGSSPPISSSRAWCCASNMPIRRGWRAIMRASRCPRSSARPPMCWNSPSAKPFVKSALASMSRVRGSA